LQALAIKETKDLFMRTLIERFVNGESGLTAYGLIAAALMLIGVGTWGVATAPHVVVSKQINPLEMMANAKDVPTSPPTIAQNGSATGAQPPAVGGAAGNPATPGPKFQTATRSHYGTKLHRKTSMSAKSTHKHKQLKLASGVSVAVPDLTQRSGAGNY
jgi:Flp pilus assembly pilin Flp